MPGLVSWGACMGPTLASGGKRVSPFVLLDLLLLSSVFVVSLLGAESPYEAMRLHARLTKSFVLFVYGPGWEGFFERLGGKRFVDYLRTASVDPAACASYAAQVRVVLAALAAVSGFLSLALVLALLTSLR